MAILTPTPSESRAAFNVDSVRRDFPFTRRRVHGKPLVYLDTAATAQRPQAVIDATTRFYTEYNANIHRAVHTLSVEATEAYESARSELQRFINAGDSREVIFTRGATESLNIVAQCHGGSTLRDGDEILLSEGEHHSNIVPWQMVAERTGAIIRVLPIDDRGEWRLDELDALLTPRTRVVSVQHVSNALGIIHPVETIIERAHAVGAVVAIDGAQAAPHLAIDLQALDADFYAISGHKMYGPTGIGVLYGKRRLLEPMPPWMGGGDMIRSVSFAKTTYNDLPNRFEAGTPNIAGAIGLGAAAGYLSRIGIDAIAAHEQLILAYAIEQLLAIDGLRIFGAATRKSGAISFLLRDFHPHDIGTIIDSEGVAIRTGHHCAQPLMNRLGVPATARASFGMYTTNGEIDVLVRALQRVVEVLG